MKKNTILVALFGACAMSVQAAVIIDFTSATNGGGGALTFATTDPDSIVISGFDLVGDGSITADITIAEADSPNELNSIGEGLGSTGAGAAGGRLAAGETLSFTFSNITGLSGGEVLSVDGLVAVQSSNDFVFSTFNGTIEELDFVSGGTSSTLTAVDPTTLTGTDLLATTNSGTLDVVHTNFDSAFSFALTEGASFSVEPGVDDFRVQGFQFSVIPEPSSAALLGLAGLGFLIRRRK